MFTFSMGALIVALTVESESVRSSVIGFAHFFLLMTSAMPLGNMPSAAASTLRASRSSTILPFATTQWPKKR